MGIARVMAAPLRLLFFMYLLAILACGRTPGRDQTRPPDVPGRGEPPADKTTIADFAKNWRQMISTVPDLALPVRRLERQPPAEAWQPRVISQCVMSAAGVLVPQVTVTWTEPAERVPDLTAAVQQRRAPATPRLRFDLALHYDGFGRNFYSAALAANRNEQFKLPSNSGLINDQASVLVTGPGLFPRLFDFNIQAVQDPGTQRQFAQHTLVLRELAHGLSYTIRLDRPIANGWSEEGHVAFLTPVCPTSF